MPATLANKSASVATLCRNDAVIHRPIIQRVIRIKWIVNYISAALEPSSRNEYECECECDADGDGDVDAPNVMGMASRIRGCSSTCRIKYFIFI